MGGLGLFGGFAPSDGEVPVGFTGKTEDGAEYIDGYKVATEEDIEWLAKLL